jgi:hypothetical protein
LKLAGLAVKPEGKPVDNAAQSLEKGGVINRVSFPVVSPHVEYPLKSAVAAIRQSSEVSVTPFDTIPHPQMQSPE